MESEETSGVPRGGPIYLPNMVGPLSTIPEFHNSLHLLLQDLETYLSLISSSDTQQYDVSTDALKLYTEEELTEMAMKEAFREDIYSQNDLEQPSITSHLNDHDQNRTSEEGVNLDNVGRIANNSPYLKSSSDTKPNKRRKRTVKKSEKAASDEGVNSDNVGRIVDNSPSLKSSSKAKPKKKKKRAGKKSEKATTVEGVNVDNVGSRANESPSVNSSSQAKPNMKEKKTEKKCEDDFLAKVEQLAQIKKMQDEEKATVGLHCLNGTCRNDESATASEVFEKMQSLRSTNYAAKLVKPSDIQDPLDTQVPEVILCIEIYGSCKSKTQEFLVLGRQTLTELKDKIHCLTDQVMKKAGEFDHSGYFLIEDIFYNDLRDPSAIDYSKPILNWFWKSKDEALRKWECILASELLRKHKELSKEVKLDLPHFRAADMQSTRFCDLRFRLGAGYLYCHQGDCKHMIIIRDMRLIHPEDDHNRAVYPRLIFHLKPRVMKCGVCKIYRATKFAVDDKWAMDNPCYFCNECFALLHSEEGPLGRDFPVYDYVYE